MYLQVIYMIHKLLENTKVVLASASPRRRDLIRMMGVKPLVVPSKVDEPDTGEAPRIQALRHARNKAVSVAANLDPGILVVGADTVVVLDKRLLGKPDSPERARQYLRLLSGRSHQVYTGICLVYRGRVLQAWEKSIVSFATLSEEEIQRYADTSEPMDKAGAYGIQGFGAQFITGNKGCYFNVMGFPLHRFYQLCQELLA